MAVSERCLVVEEQEGERVVPVLPNGQADATTGLRLMGQDYALGDRVELTGGYASTPPQQLPAGCTDQEPPLFIVAAP